MTTAPTKKWYEKPENVLVYGGMGLLGWVALQAADSILPMLVRVLENSLHATFLAIALGTVGFLAVNGDFHRLLWLGYTSGMRKLTSVLVELDPINIMRGIVAQLRMMLNEIGQNLGNLRGQADKLQQRIQDKIKDHEHNMSMAVQAKSRGDQAGMQMSMRLYARKAGRAEESTLTYQGLLNKVLKHIAVMEKVKEASEFMIEDMEDTIKEEAEKREMIHASFKAMNAAKRILAASKQREVYDMALEANTQDYYSKLGEITQFMQDSQHFINTMDLENGVVESEALAKLEEWENRSLALLEGGSGKTKYRVLPAGDENITQLLGSGGEATTDKSFADMFKKLD